RPSQATSQKRVFKDKIHTFAKGIKESAYTDITGGLIQGAEYLNETKSGIKTIVIFSDMQEELGKGTIRDFPISLDGFRIVALNVTKLGTDNADPRLYLDRLARWEARVRKAGATEWVVVNDLEHNLESISTRRTLNRLRFQSSGTDSRLQRRHSGTIPPCGNARFVS
ncbi:MAG: hypothetical protein HP491_19385, partial [Nitrospira sp.]|nr:hypothetical protein [Nitrospira sp.]